MLGGEEGPALPQSWWGWPQHPAGSPHTAIICWWWRDWLAEGEFVQVQHAPASLLHALCWEVSKWQVFKKPKDLCCIPWGMMQSVITEGTEPADFCSTAAARIDPTCRENGSCLLCFCYLGGKITDRCGRKSEALCTADVKGSRKIIEVICFTWEMS